MAHVLDYVQQRVLVSAKATVIIVVLVVVVMGVKVDAVMDA